MTNSKFNFKTKKILLMLLTIAILAISISNASASVSKVEFASNTPTEVDISSGSMSYGQMVVFVYDNSGNPAHNVDVQIYKSNIGPEIHNTKNRGFVTFMPILTLSQSNITYTAIAGGITKSHTIRYIDPSASSGGGSGSGSGGGSGSGSGDGSGGGSGSGSGDGSGDSSSLSLKKGVIYKNNKVVGIWDGNNAYTLNSAGRFAVSSSYTNQVKQALDKGQITPSKISATSISRMTKFINNVASNRIVNSAVESTSKIYTRANKRTIAFKLIADDIANSNLGKSHGNNRYISTNAIKNVLSKEVNKKYIARKNIKVSNLKSVLDKGRAVLRVKKADNRWYFISISKVSNKRVTVWDNKKSQRIAVNSLTSHFKKNKYRFSGVAITYNVKAGKVPTTNNLKVARGL
jgi:hypothetical protein